MALNSKFNISGSGSSYNELFKFVIINTTTECVDLHSHKRDQGYFTRFNFYASLIIFMLGIFGNLAAIYFISPSNFNIKIWYKRHYFPITLSVNQYSLRSFYIICLFSVVTILLNPVLKIYADSSNNIKWFSYGWMVYQAKFHFPIARTLTSTAFQISVILFVNQIIAIKYPFKYRTLVTIYRIRLVILALLIYCFVWNIPTEKWYYVTKVLLCPFNSNLTTYIYVYKLWIPASRVNYMNWTAYEIARELMVDILPFFIMVCTKIWVIHHRRSIKPSLTQLPTTLNGNSSSLLQPSQNSDRSKTGLWLSSTFQNWLERSILFSSILKLSEVEKTDGDRKETRKNSTEIAKQRKHVLGKRVLEEKQHKRTLLILGMEFLLLLLPIVIFDMVAFYLERFYDNPILSNIYISITLLQYVYIGGTFYINLAFNRYYRKTVFNQVRKDYLKFRRIF